MANNPLVRGGKVNIKQPLPTVLNSEKKYLDRNIAGAIQLGSMILVGFLVGKFFSSVLGGLIGSLLGAIISTIILKSYGVKKPDTKAKVFYCPDCEEEFDYVQDMIAHSKNCKENVFECPECGETYNTEKAKDECWANCLTEEE